MVTKANVGRPTTHPMSPQSTHLGVIGTAARRLRLRAIRNAPESAKRADAARPTMALPSPTPDRVNNGKRSLSDQ